MKIFRSPLILLAFVLLLIGLVAAWCFDLANGDGNGIVAGVKLAPLISFLAAAFLTYLVILAVLIKQKFAQNLLLLLLVVGGMLWALEWIAGKYVAFQAANAPRLEGPVHSMELDSVLGYKPLANSELTAKKTKNDTTLYAVNFKTDAHSLRITPTDSAIAPTQFAQFYGCSMTFGEGVQSNETLPYYFGKENPAFRPYNFAYSGYGPSQLLARLQAGQVPNIVSQKDGFAVYVFIQDHVNRVINSYTNYAYNRGEVPRFVKENGQLVRKGTYATTQRLRNAIFDAMQRSNLLKLFKIGYPFKLSTADYELTADIIAEAAKLYEKQFGNKKFAVVIYPTKGDNSQFISQLKERRVKVLDYSKLFDPTDTTFAIPFDEHPTPAANAALAKQLTKDMASF